MNPEQHQSFLGSLSQQGCNDPRSFLNKYHPGKANVVADALSRKSGMVVGIKVEKEIIRDLERLGIELLVSGQQGYWASLRIEP
nr:DNA/RNA polymerase superfamily protein [Tanacetum cinerariifolium]